MCGDIHGRGSQSERYRSPETMAGNEEKEMVGWSVEEGNGGEGKEWGGRLIGEGKFLSQC